MAIGTLHTKIRRFAASQNWCVRCDESIWVPYLGYEEFSVVFWVGVIGGLVGFWYGGVDGCFWMRHLFFIFCFLGGGNNFFKGVFDRS